MDFSAVNEKRAKAAARRNQRLLKRAILFPDQFKRDQAEIVARKSRPARKVKKAKRKKLPSLTKLRKECWKALSLYVRARDADANQGLCLICSKNPISLAYHLIPAGSGSAAKWDPLNIVGGCRDCNCGEFNRRVKYAYIHIELFGLEYMTALEVRSRQMVQYKRHDFLAMTADFSARLAVLEGKPNPLQDEPPGLAGEIVAPLPTANLKETDRHPPLI